MCAEKNKVPSLKILLSIYGVQYLSGQVYVDTRTGQSKIVSVKSSNSGYHPRWVYFYGPDLESVRPCRAINKASIDYLNNLEKYDNVYLDSFQGREPVYGHLKSKNEDFFTGHSRKRAFFNFIFFFSFVFLASLLLKYM